VRIAENEINFYDRALTINGHSSHSSGKLEANYFLGGSRMRRKKGKRGAIALLGALGLTVLTPPAVYPYSNPK
jgi:hypothetical protein